MRIEQWMMISDLRFNAIVTIYLDTDDQCDDNEQEMLWLVIGDFHNFQEFIWSLIVW